MVGTAAERGQARVPRQSIVCAKTLLRSGWNGAGRDGVCSSVCGRVQAARVRRGEAQELTETGPDSPHEGTPSDRPALLSHCLDAALKLVWLVVPDPAKRRIRRHCMTGRTSRMMRRAFLKASALAPVLAPAVVAMGGVPAALSQGMPPLAQFADELNTDLFASDGLAVPIAAGPTASKVAAGLDRTLVLGGGGEYYVAWYCGFFHGLFEQGVDAPSLAEMIVGTSAGSYVGSSMASGHFQRLRTEFDFFGHFPGLFARLAPVTEPNASQMRAQKINAAAKDGILGHLAHHRTRGARCRQPIERSRGRARRGTSHRRQQDLVAGAKDAHHGRRLLHR